MSIASELSALNGHILSAYDEIEDKGGTIPQNKNMSNLATAIASISGGGGGNNNWSTVMGGQSTDLYDNDITYLIKDALLGYGAAPVITSISFPELLTIGGQHCFEKQSNLTLVNLPKLETLNHYTFYYCSKLNEIILPCVRNHEGSSLTYCFAQCSRVKKIDLGNNSVSSQMTFSTQCFGSDPALQALVLRWNTMATCTSSGAFSSSAIASGTGYIYVPTALLDSYKTASGWKTYKDQFRAIESYSSDGTVNGDIVVT